MLSSSSEKQFIQLVEVHQGIIHKICRMYSRDPEDHKDLFQEILLQLWRSFGNFRAEAKPSTWMYQVGLNTAISSLRKSKSKAPSTPLEDYLLQLPDMKDNSEAEEDQLQYLYQAINQLSDVEKALVMLYLEDRSYDEMAQILGISKTNVGAKLTRVKQKLQKKLNPANSCS